MSESFATFHIVTIIWAGEMAATATTMTMSYNTVKEHINILFMTFTTTAIFRPLSFITNSTHSPNYIIFSQMDIRFTALLFCFVFIHPLHLFRLFFRWNGEKCYRYKISSNAVFYNVPWHFGLLLICFFLCIFLDSQLRLHEGVVQLYYYPSLMGQFIKATP